MLLNNLEKGTNSLIYPKRLIRACESDWRSANRGKLLWPTQFVGLRLVVGRRIRDTVCRRAPYWLKAVRLSRKTGRPELYTRVSRTKVKTNLKVVEIVDSLRLIQDDELVVLRTASFVDPDLSYTDLESDSKTVDDKSTLVINHAPKQLRNQKIIS